MKHLHGMVLWLLGLACLISASVSRADINIGLVLSLTGSAASVGIPAKNTALLWPKEVAGQKVNVFMLDDASDPNNAAIAAKRLIQEHAVDLLIGSSATPTSLAVLQVAGETQTPMISLGGSNALVLPQEGMRRWAFKIPPSEEIQLKYVLENMRQAKGQKLAIVAVNNAYGETFVDVAQKMVAEFGIQIVDVERFSPNDTSVVAQTLKVIASHADAVFIVAVGTPAALPHVELKQKGYRGTIYQTQGAANNDFLRIGGKDLEGALLPVAPLLVAEQLPDSNPVKAAAITYVKLFEGKYGDGSRSLFGGLAWDAFTLFEKAAPKALKQAQPGTGEFRAALRDALEATKGLVITHGVYSMSANDHNGADSRSQVLVKIENGKWRYVK